MMQYIKMRKIRFVYLSVFLKQYFMVILSMKIIINSFAMLIGSMKILLITND